MYIAKDIDARIKQIPFNGTISNMQWSCYDINDADVYENPTEMEFEGYKFCVPGNYEKYLKRYMGQLICNFLQKNTDVHMEQKHTGLEMKRIE